MPARQHAEGPSAGPAPAARRGFTPAPTGRASSLLALQAAAGNRAVTTMLAPVQRCGDQQCDDCGTEAPPEVQRIPVQRLTVQRDMAAAKAVRTAVAKPDPDGKGAGYQEAFHKLNSLPMYDMLSTLTSLRRTGEFEQLDKGFRFAVGVNVERLNVAFEAVKSKGQPGVEAFLMRHKDALGRLFDDQRRNIVDYLDPGWYDSLKDTEEIDSLLTAIKANPAYASLSTAPPASGGKPPKELADDIITKAATVPAKQIYFLTKLKLLFDTAEKSTADVSTDSRAAATQAVAAETKRLKDPNQAKLAGVEEAGTMSRGRKWTVMTGVFGGGKFYVDRSSPTSIFVKAKVFLQPGPGATADDIKKIKSIEDAIEKAASTKGYSVDIEFVESAGPDKRGNPPFSINVHPGGWTNATNWGGAGRPLAIAHELHHCFAFELDRYDYIEAHAKNTSMDIPTRLIWFRKEMDKPVGYNDPTSLMNSALHPNDDDVCRVAGLDLASCIALRQKPQKKP